MSTYSQDIEDEYVRDCPGGSSTGYRLSAL